MDVLAKINEFLGGTFPEFDFLAVKPKNIIFGDTLFCVVSELEKNKIEYEHLSLKRFQKDTIATNKNGKIYGLSYGFQKGVFTRVTINITDEKEYFQKFLFFIKSYFEHREYSEELKAERFSFNVEESKNIDAKIIKFEGREILCLVVTDFKVYPLPKSESIDVQPKEEREYIEPQQQNEPEEKVQWLQEPSEAERLKDIIRKRTE